MVTLDIFEISLNNWTMNVRINCLELISFGLVYVRLRGPLYKDSYRRFNFYSLAYELEPTSTVRYGQFLPNSFYDLRVIEAHLLGSKSDDDNRSC